MGNDGSGLISKEEFATMKYDANVMTALRDLGIKEKQFDMYVQLLFDLPDKDPSDQGEASMGLEKLVEALCRLRPGAAVNLLDWSTFKTAVLRSQDEVQERVKKVYRLLRQKSKGGSVPSTPRIYQPIQEQPAQPKSPWKLSNRIMDEHAKRGAFLHCGEGVVGLHGPSAKLSGGPGQGALCGTLQSTTVDER
ncbi:hypothetical protein AK812_SmicGene3532 [Symbiodinium microadriaticum]|uniref:Uncharacterized protein n=1 Tax=Symbiodinium microadriaticum TaxID=2951 RepID=A0A1Q9EYY3_SYMMI|nr:hypothetical protein AK812_SmicGene3532 [Symbiodinium microadriaticum]